MNKATSTKLAGSLLAFGLLAAASNQAAAATWANTLADGDVNNAGNWAGGLPSDAGANGAVVASTPLVINQVFNNGGDNRSEFLVTGTGGLTVAAGGSFTYLGDGLLGTTAFSVGGASTITHTGGTLTQDGGGAGLLIGHNAVGTYNISGGNLYVQGGAPTLTIDFTAGAAGSSLNISGTGQVDVETGVGLVINAGGTLDVSGGGLLVWHDRTVAETVSFAGTVNATITQVGSDVHFTALSQPDTDSDNLPDDWELAQTNVSLLTDLDGNITDPMGASGAMSGDFDGDGLADIDEYHGGIDSTDAGDPDSDGDTLLDGVETRTLTFVSASDTGTNPKNPDTDDDGLRDDYENGDDTYLSPTQTGSDPNTKHSDPDPLEDGFEVTNAAAGYDPNVDDSGSDFDSDTSTVTEELARGTDILDPDSDNDNLLDGWETDDGNYVDGTHTGTDPLNPDTDADGLQDDVETNDDIFDSATDTGTDPNIGDSDADGWDDGVEVAYGTNPNLIGEVPNPMGVPTVNLIQDLDAEIGVTTDEVGITDWFNQAASGGDDVAFAGASDPQLLAAATPTGLAAVDFDGDDKLVGDDNAAFDALIQGGGLTWLAVVKIGDNEHPVADINRIFGTLTNDLPFSGYIANLTNDERLGCIVRPGPDATASFQVDDTTGLNDGSWHVVGGRLGAGTGDQIQDVFVDSSTAVASGLATVRAAADSDGISVGSERTGGLEYGIFTLARLLIYDRPLVDAELAEAVSFLDTTYIGSGAATPVLLIDSLMGTTLTMTVTGAPNTTYVCKSGTDLMSFPDTEATSPAAVTTGPDTGDGTGTATFSIDIGARTDLFLRMESAP